jgi:hypothetical protein
MGMLQKCVAMSGCKEWLVLLMNNGELRAWHRIDMYWDNDIEHIDARENIDKALMHASEGTLQVVKWVK